MQIQIFGTKKSSETRKALRFFSERRIQAHFVDVKRKAPSRRELERFVRRLSVDGVLDPSSKRFLELGLGTAHLSDERWMERMTEEPMILRLPLVRNGNQVTVGDATDEWKRWCE